MKNLLEPVLLFFITLTLSSCATDVDLKKKFRINAGIKVTDLSFLSSPKAAKCKKLMPVLGSSAAKGGSKRAAIDSMKESAYEVNANVIASNLAFERTPGIFVSAERVRGIALKCPEKEFSKVIRIEDQFVY